MTESNIIAWVFPVYGLKSRYQNENIVKSNYSCWVVDGLIHEDVFPSK